MAIFPFSNAYVINKDAVAGSSFKAGMVLMINAAGNVVAADSQLLVYKTLAEKQNSIIGIAAGDSNLTGNTIIVPDYIGSNYLDSNSNFVSVSDREYVSVRRQLLDYADETVNEYYNINYSPKPKRTGIGIYPLSGDTFATDQFNPVLHGEFGIDGTTIQSLNPGDLLTIGGGINAGKLVKVNTNSIGTDIVVVGIVDRYNSTTGLLYFRQTNSSFSSSGSVSLYYDTFQTTSYSGSGNVWKDLLSSSSAIAATTPVFTNYKDGIVGRKYDLYFADNLSFFDTATVTAGPDTYYQLYQPSNIGDFYSHMWTGYFRPRLSGNYTFSWNTDDSGLMWIGPNAVSGYSLSNLFIDNRGTHPPVLIGNQISLTAETLYPIRLIYGEYGGGDTYELQFYGPGIGASMREGLGYLFSDNTNPVNKFVFDGTTQYFTVSNPNLPSGASARSVVIWANTAFVNDSITRIIFSYGTNSLGQGFSVGKSSTGAYLVDGVSDTLTSGTWTSATWTFLVATYNGTTLSLYVNGSLVTSTAKTFNTVLSSSFIGRNINNSNYWAGDISEVKVVNRSLTASEISSYYNNTKSRYGL